MVGIRNSVRVFQEHRIFKSFFASYINFIKKRSDSKRYLTLLAL